MSKIAYNWATTFTKKRGNVSIYERTGLREIRTTIKEGHKNGNNLSARETDSWIIEYVINRIILSCKDKTKNPIIKAEIKALP